MEIKIETVNEQRKLKRLGRQSRIFQNKQQARSWVENRRLHRVPLVLAQELTNATSFVSTRDPQVVQTRQDLELRKSKLLKEAEEIKSAIEVIKQTYF